MLAAVRVRGVPDTRRKASGTLQSLRLQSPNSCVVLPDTDANRGMLQQVKDYVAYGGVDDEVVVELLRERGTVDGTALTDGIDTLGYDSVDDLVAALADEEVSPGELHDRGLDLPLRLSPPAKGYRDTKRHARQGGSLGERDDMADLLQRMR